MDVPPCSAECQVHHLPDGFQYWTNYSTALKNIYLLPILVFVPLWHWTRTFDSTSCKISKKRTSTYFKMFQRPQMWVNTFLGTDPLIPVHKVHYIRHLQVTFVLHWGFPKQIICYISLLCWQSYSKCFYGCAPMACSWLCLLLKNFHTISFRL